MPSDHLPLPARPGPRRAGRFLLLAIAVLVALVALITGLHMMSRQASRDLRRVDGFLRAVAVGEACYHELVARMESTAWEDRWFRGGARTGDGRFEEGRYRYLVCDAGRDPEADLLVAATVEFVTITMYWRLRPEPGPNSSPSRVRACYFSYPDPSLPLTPDVLAPLRDEARRAREDRARRPAGAGAGVRRRPGRSRPSGSAQE